MAGGGGCGWLGDAGSCLVAFVRMERGLTRLVVGSYTFRGAGLQCVHADLRHYPGGSGSGAHGWSDAEEGRSGARGLRGMAGTAVPGALADAIVR